MAVGILDTHQDGFEHLKGTDPEMLGRRMYLYLDKFAWISGLKRRQADEKPREDFTGSSPLCTSTPLKAFMLPVDDSFKCLIL